MSDYGLSPALIVLWIIVAIVLIVAYWKIYTKAGKFGWAVLIPFHNLIILLEIVEKPYWWFIMMFIPVVNIVFGIMIVYNLVLKFGKPGWHTILAIIVGVVYYPYLAFSDASYQG